MIDITIRQANYFYIELPSRRGIRINVDPTAKLTIRKKALKKFIERNRWGSISDGWGDKIIIRDYLPVLKFLATGGSKKVLKLYVEGRLDETRLLAMVDLEE